MWGPCGPAPHCQCGPLIVVVVSCVALVLGKRGSGHGSSVHFLLTTSVSSRVSE